MGGDQEFGLLLMMTLKDAPELSFTLPFSPDGDSQEPAGAIE